MNKLFYDTMLQLQDWGVSSEHAEWATRIVILMGVALISFIITFATHKFIIPVIHTLTAKTKSTWDENLLNDNVVKSFSRIISPIIWYWSLPFVIPDMPSLLSVAQKCCIVYLIVIILRFISNFLTSLYELGNEKESMRNRPLKGIYQTINLIAICIGVILIISTLIDKDATTILAGLGASAAVLMLIFKDSILGLVAGIQLSANDMMRPGDWITMAKYGADGTVIEVSLTTVKVQNFDMTITTIPPYALVSDSFQNWRGMSDSGGRRIKRSLLIDLYTIRFCTEEEVKIFMDKGWLDESDINSGKEIVNLYVFRKYIQQYLQNNSDISKDMLQLVRQLDPTNEGLPIELYCFTSTTDWVAYESIQNEVFEHLIATLPKFGLRNFQRSSGSETKLLSSLLETED